MMSQFVFAQEVTPVPVADGANKCVSDHRHHSEKRGTVGISCKGLGLTDQQKEQIKPIFEGIKQKISSILTPE